MQVSLSISFIQEKIGVDIQHPFTDLTIKPTYALFNSYGLIPFQLFFLCIFLSDSEGSRRLKKGCASRLFKVSGKSKVATRRKKSPLHIFLGVLCSVCGSLHCTPSYEIAHAANDVSRIENRYYIRKIKLYENNQTIQRTGKTECKIWLLIITKDSLFQSCHQKVAPYTAKKE